MNEKQKYLLDAWKKKMGKNEVVVFLIIIRSTLNVLQTVFKIFWWVGFFIFSVVSKFKIMGLFGIMTQLSVLLSKKFYVQVQSTFDIPTDFPE